MRVLIVDDSPAVRGLLLDYLGGWGHEVVSATDGEEAWSLLQASHVDLTICDWTMPGMSGVELCTKIRQDFLSRYIYIILLTSRDDRADVLEGLEAGADDYMTKPFDRDVLRLRLRAGQRVVDLQSELQTKNEELADLNRQLEGLARTDALTGAANRRSLDESLGFFQDRAQRYGDRYGLILCDLDLFKTYNDTYGHVAGDLVLKNVARVIQKHIRRSDQLFRYGGEELAVIVPSQDRNETVCAAERIREAVEGLKIEHAGLPGGCVTMSCGVAVSQSGTSANGEDVVRRADKGLYQAKEEGRNRVCEG